MIAATILSFLLSVVLVILQSQRVLPTVDLVTQAGFTIGYSPWTFLTGSFSFFVLLRYWHLIPEAFGFGQRYFFDKLGALAPVTAIFLFFTGGAPPPPRTPL